MILFILYITLSMYARQKSIQTKKAPISGVVWALWIIDFSE